MSNPGTPPTPRPEALKKLAQLRIERLKKEEEEEQWISGEELYTEGSSDEDDTALRAKRKSNERGLKKSSRSTGSKSKKHVKEENKKPQSHLTPPRVNLTSCSENNEVKEKTTPLDSSKDEKSVDKGYSELDLKGFAGDTLASSSSTQDDEIQAEISWRPKRGLENKGVIPVVDTHQAYCTMIERVKKLKVLFMDDSSIFSRMSDGKTSNHLRQETIGCIKTNENGNLCKLLTSDWHFLHEKCDVGSALTNMKTLDLLLEIIDYKQKEAHEETLIVQRQIRDELSQFIISHEPTDDEVTRNISSFLQLWLLAENKDNVKDIKSLDIGKDMQDAKCMDFHNQYVQAKGSEFIEHTNSVELTLFNKSLTFENETSEYKVNVPQDEKTNVLDDIEDGEQIVPFTDDEKQRLESLLDDNELHMFESHINDDNSVSNSVDGDFERPKNYEAYAFNQETKQTLEKINEKLQAFSETYDKNEILCHISCRSYTRCDLLEDENKVSEENNEQL